MPGSKASEATRREQIVEAAYEVAARAGIAGLTVRAVAARAKLSHGLVLFHFKRKDQLVGALLDRVLETTLTLRVPEHVARLPRALDRLRALLRQEAERLSREPRRTRLFLEFWALGTRQAAIRARIGAGLGRYRAALLAVSEEPLGAGPARFRGVTPDGLAGLAVSFITGCAVQAAIDPDQFDREEYLATADGVLGGLAAPMS